ncbi:MAG: hypothetical protein MUO40_14100, partial [Anaerolineaceae bacterium]|nr:hypothetical protein [Anaerolineaceae bacterium]
HKILIHLCLLTLILVTSSCTLRQTAKDPLTILTMKTCEPPCWQGIIPGITTLDDAKFLIQNIIYFPKRPDILTPSKIYKDGVIRAEVSFLEPNVEVNIYADEEGIVDYIIFKFPGRNYLHLGDCIDLYGEPQFIGLSIVKGLRFTYNAIQLSYPDIGISFLADMPRRSDLVKIPYSSSTKISTIVYSSEPIERTDFDFIFPWNEEATLQFEKNY